MQLWEMQNAVDDARRTIRNADEYVGRMAMLIRGRLQRSDVGHDTLKILKDELRNYNVLTKAWKDES